MRPSVQLALPFQGTWLAQNTPARRVPSHGTTLFGQAYAIDFVAVEGGRSASVHDWRAAFGVEPAERFFGFGRPILAPAPALVLATHDGEPDHEARRSPLTLLHYALTQRARLRQGLGAVAGNHVILALGDDGPYVVVVHLRKGSLSVGTGDVVTTGQQLALCGNSGNSTQPHVHIQAMDAADPETASGLPIAFRRYRAWPRGGSQPRDVSVGIPGPGEIVEPLATGR